MTDPALAQSAPAAAQTHLKRSQPSATASLWRSRWVRLAPVLARWTLIVAAVVVAFWGWVSGVIADFTRGGGELAYLRPFPCSP